jgi:tetratricopeptide (TPR) repeat protein
MRFMPFIKIQAAGKFFVVLLILLCTRAAFCQKSKADSLLKLLRTEKKDTNQARMMWQLADFVSIYNPDSALRLSQKAVYLSREIKYTEGQSRSLGIQANTFMKMGNYPRALQLYIQKLQLEEKRNSPRNLASVLINIGILYVLQEEYTKALGYYSRADSVIQVQQVEEMKYFIFVNLGDVYNRLDANDSAFKYFNQSLAIGRHDNDADLIGTSLTGMGHCYLKKKDYPQSLLSYQTAITHLIAANDDEMLSEATLGLAKLYELIDKKDSAALYATRSLAIAKGGDFLSHELEAAAFLTNHYKNNKNIDSAFVYVNREQDLNDSLYSKSRIRESQILTTNEQLRQLEIEENKKIAAQERYQQLQLLFIGIFIPGFFLLTLLLSRIKIHIRIVKVMGVLSLLVLFEYLTLLLHPYVLEFTHHTPVYEILIFVAIAAILIPAHHRIEHWLIKKLTSRKEKTADNKIRLTTVKIKMKDPSG